MFKVLGLDSGLDIDENNELTSIFDINIMIIDQKLKTSITYRKDKLENNTIEKFSNMYIKQIEIMLEHCCEKDDIELTVSDFDGVDISQEDLDSLFM